MNFWNEMGKRIPQKWKKWNKQDWIAVILIGVLILVVAIPTGGSGDEDQAAGDASGGSNLMERTKNVGSEGTDGSGDSDSGSADQGNLSQGSSYQGSAYQENMEERLEELLSGIEGAGEVRVMLTLKDQGEDVLDKDISSGENSYQENTVLYDDSEGTMPYITKENTPKVCGVVVLSEGADNAVVRTEISDAVAALFEIEAHKIQVLKLKGDD